MRSYLLAAVPALLFSVVACTGNADLEGSASTGGSAGASGSVDTHGQFGGRCVPTSGLALRSLEAGCSATYGGRARVLAGTIKPLIATLTVNVGDTGPLPAAGTMLTAGAASTSTAGITGGLATAATVGTDGQTTSEASILSLGLGVLGISIGADKVQSRAIATCGATSGTSTIANLKIAGAVIPVTGAPNQTVTSGLVTIKINEQVSTTSGIQVNALRISALGVADIVVAATEASIACSCPNGTGSSSSSGGTTSSTSSGGIVLPEITLPGLTDAGITIPEVNLPILTDAGITIPEVNLPILTDAGITIPEVTLPVVVLPEVTLPGVIDAGTAVPEAGTPPSSSSSGGSSSGQAPDLDAPLHGGGLGAACDRTNPCAADYQCATADVK